MSRPPRTVHTRWRRPLAAVFSIAAVLLLVLSLARFVDAAESWLVPTLQAGAPWAAGAAAIAGLGAAVFVPRSWTAWLLFLATVTNIATALIFVAPAPPGNDDAVSEERVTVVSFNALYGHGDPAQLLAEAGTVEADVMILLETDRDYVARFDAAGAAERFPFRLVSDAPGGAATAVLSAVPLEEVSLNAAHQMRFASWAAEIRVGDGDVRLRAVHPVPPLDGRSSVWRDEIRGLDAWVEDTDGPLLVAGDFNASAAHPPFRHLCQGPGALKGCGSIFTTPTWAPREWIPPVLPLDHILTRGLAVTERGIFEVAGSDHRAVWAVIAPVSR